MTGPGRGGSWRLVTAAAKVGVPPLVLGWLGWTLAADERFSGLTVNWPMVAVAAVLYAGAVFFNALRLSRVVRSLCGRLGAIDAWRICVQSTFYFVFVPLSAGFDVARFTKISALDSGLKRSGVVGALFLDRVLGLSVPLAVFFIAAAWPGLVPEVEMGAGTQWALLGALALCCCVGVLLVRRSGPWKVVRDLLNDLGSNWPCLFGAWAWTVAAHACLYVSVWCLALSMGLDVLLLQVVIGCVCGLILQTIPLSLAGLGPGEAAGVFVYGFFGFAMHDAVLLALLPYLFRLGTACCGGIWEWLDGVGSLRRLRK